MSKLSKIDIFYRGASMNKYSTLQRTATYLLSAALVVPLPVFGAGALAIDSRQGSQWGWAINQQTYDEAEQRALQECGYGCRVVMTFSDSCAAYAADQQYGSTVYGWSSGHSSSGGAKQSARSECESRGGSGADCIVRVWGCDSF